MTARTFTEITCNTSRCMATIRVHATDPELARAQAADAGWSSQDDLDHCHPCTSIRASGIPKGPTPS
ncbi:hypothetical protein ABZ815_20380 [Nonomuraea sp. NPDC047529]|uniref:hypothetical protein n=1 Tax=Nonomuraea sp. NPDC047529 TaxID=3155623 RepID=UPI0033CB2B81